MSTRMRFRTDASWKAEDAARLARGEPVLACDCGDADCPARREVVEAEARDVPPAEPGDTWALYWHREEGPNDQLAGYMICCPRCRQIHHWSSASNCGSKRQLDGGGWTCDHQVARTSCWEWTGSAEENVLTARPSLYASGACGWHGWLTAGELKEC